jgi:predicted dehydrogenase
MSVPPSRREFLKSAGLGTLATVAASRAARAHVLPLRQTPPASANDRLQIALIGAGIQGHSDTAVALQVPGVEIVAACDVYDGRLTRAKEVWGDALVTTRRYEEVLARPDVDAVLIATPDHWHQKIAVDALAAGKDVYVEKPMVQHVEQGQAIIDAAKKNGRILQVGSQRVSSIVYEKARQLVAAGAIGELNLIEAFIDRNSALGAWQYPIPPDASEQTIDWARFLGPAPKRPFEAIRVFRFRNYRDYGTGVGGDLFVHLLSGIHYILSSHGPTRVLSTGGLRFWKDGRDVPDVLLTLFDYPKTDTHPAFNLALKVNFVSGAGETSVFRFVGSDGVLTLAGRGITVAKDPRPRAPGYIIDSFPKAQQEAFLQEYYEKYPQEKARREMEARQEESWNAPDGYSDSYDHFANFFEAVRTRKPVVEDAVFGLRAAAPALLANVSYFEDRPVYWDPEKMVEVKRGPATSARR